MPNSVVGRRELLYKTGSLLENHLLSETSRDTSFLRITKWASQLPVAIRRVMEGERVVDPELALAALAEGNNPLTNREREVWSVALSGASLADIATQLILSEGTVRNHLSTAHDALQSL